MNEHDDWVTKHRARRAAAAGDPDPFVLAALDALGDGMGRTVWDLAAGRGRHALELARRGYRVTAFDRSAEALRQVESHAGAEGTSIATLQIDLESSDWSHASPEITSADLIVVVNFLDRELFERLPSMLKPGGHVLITTFTVDRAGDHPSERWCLQRGELSSRFSDACIELATEHEGRAGVLARFGEKCS